MSMSNANSSLNKNMGILLIAILSIAVIAEFSQFTNVNALKNYFNCTTKKVNNNDNFAIQDAFKCYDNVFKGAQEYVNETYQNPDVNNLNAIKDVVYTKPNTSVDSPTTATTTTSDNVTNSKIKTTTGGDKLILPIKLNDDLKTTHVSKTVHNEKPDVPDNTDMASETTHVSKTVHNEKPDVPDNTDMASEKSPESTPDFNLNSDFPSNPQSFDLPFAAVIPK
jgi:hypothetical protein